MIQNLIILAVISTAIWFIVYVFLYPKKVWKDIKRLTMYDVWVSLFSLLILWIISNILGMKFYIDGKEFPMILVCFFISWLTEIPFFFRYQWKNKIDYMEVMKYQTWFTSWRDFLIWLGLIVFWWTIIWLIYKFFS